MSTTGITGTRRATMRRRVAQVIAALAIEVSQYFPAGQRTVTFRTGHVTSSF
jgi:hypothetical protein